MPITISWDNDQRTIIREVFEGVWSWDDFHAAARQAAELMGSVEHRVDILADLRSSELLPAGTATAHASLALRMAPPNWGVLVVVTNSRFIRLITAVFRRLTASGSGTRTFIAASPDEAYAILRARTQTHGITSML